MSVKSIAAAPAKLLQSCPTLCDPIHGSPLGSPVPGSLQARTLEWVAISSSNAWKWKVKVKSLSPVWLLATPWTAAHQAPPSMWFSRQECWSGVPLPSPTMDQLDLIDIYRTFHSQTMNFTFFSSAHGTFSRIDHVLGRKPRLGKLKKITVNISSINASLFRDNFRFILKFKQTFQIAFLVGCTETRHSSFM